MVFNGSILELLTSFKKGHYWGSTLCRALGACLNCTLERAHSASSFLGKGILFSCLFLVPSGIEHFHPILSLINFSEHFQSNSRGLLSRMSYPYLDGLFWHTGVWRLHRLFLYFTLSGQYFQFKMLLLASPLCLLFTSVLAMVTDALQEKNLDVFPFFCGRPFKGLADKIHNLGASMVGDLWGIYKLEVLCDPYLKKLFLSLWQNWTVFSICHTCL